MASFRTTHTQTLSTTANQTVIVNHGGSASVRCHLYEIELGSVVGGGNPVVDAAEIALRASTAAGSGGTNLDEVNTNPPGAAAVVACTGGNHTTDPTTAASGNFKLITLRKELPWKWQGYPGREIISVPAAGGGLALVTISIVGTAFAAKASTAWLE